MNLTNRNEQIVEAMDDANCDHQLFLRTHQQLATVNRLLCRWRHLYTRHIRPRCQAGETYRLLDVGCGTGHLLITLSNWARRDQINFQLVGIDLDDRAFTIAEDGVSLRRQAIEAVAADSEHFDFVVCNHVLHHLGASSVPGFLAAIESVTTRVAIVNDIERSQFAYRAFPLVGLWFRKSWILSDGLLSIRRSFTQAELIRQASPLWQIQKLIPSRLVAIYNAKL